MREAMTGLRSWSDTAPVRDGGERALLRYLSPPNLWIIISRYFGSFEKQNQVRHLCAGYRTIGESIAAMQVP